MADKSFLESYEELPKIAKVILLIFLGWIICGVYRIIRFVETKNVVTLVVGIVALVTGIGNLVLCVVDIVTEILHNRVTVFAD